MEPASAQLAGLLDQVRDRAERGRGQWSEFRRELHRHPELSRQERETQRRIGQWLEPLGIEVRSPFHGTGLLALIRPSGTGPQTPAIAYRADIDALPIQEAATERNGTYRSAHDGVMHACGHDVHTAIAAGVAHVLAPLREQLPAPVKILFQPAEETEGGADGMIEAGALADPPAREIFGLHADPALPVGTVAFCPGVAWASVDNFQIDVHGRQAHAVRPWQGRDALLAACQLVVQLPSLVTREVPTATPAVLSVGEFRVLEPANGGRRNVLAAHVQLRGTMRTLDPQLRQRLRDRVEALCRALAAAFDLPRVDLEWINACPAGIPDPELNAWAERTCTEWLGPERVRRHAPSMGGEDFAYYMQKVPGVFFRLGTAAPDGSFGSSGLHTAEFDIDEAALPFGVGLAARLLLAAAQR